MNVEYFDGITPDHKIVRILESALASMRVKLDAAEADSRRLDWLERKGFATRNESTRQNPAVHCWSEVNGKWMWTAQWISSEFTSARAAIDAAMNAESET